MDLETRSKMLHKTTKKHVADLAALKKLLEEGGKKNTKATQDILSRMIIRTETIWQSLRGLGRDLKEIK